MPGIGVMSTIAFTDTDWEYAFKGGLDDETWYLQDAVQENVGYQPADLQAALGTLNGNANVTHIVTVGGLTAAVAANAYGNHNARAKPFFSLVGATSCDFPGANPPASFQGGVILESYSHNADRLDHLTGRDEARAHNFQNSDIALLLNPDSAVKVDEKLRWPSDGGTIYEANDQNTIQTAINQFAASPHKALIISADPFFTENMDYVIPRANASKKHVCYPFQEYANPGTGKQHPPHGHHTLHGPSLSEAYTRFGEVVSEIINANGTQSPKLDPGPAIHVKDP
jgi:hypothetical protein